MTVEADRFDWFDDAERLEYSLAELEQADDPETIAPLLNHLSLFPNEPRAVEALAGFLNHEDETVATVAIEGLEDVKGARSVEVIGAALDAPGVKRERRKRMVEALMYLREEEGAAAALARALDDEDTEIRQEAAMNIVLTGDQATARPALQKALEIEQDEETRRILSRALEILSDREAGRESQETG